MNPAWQVFGIILSAAATLIGGLVLLNLQSLSKRLLSQEQKLGELEAKHQRLAERKVDCQTEFVGSAAWVREAGYTRARLDEVVSIAAQLSAKVDMRTELPQIASQVAAATVEAMFERMDRK